MTKIIIQPKSGEFIATHPVTGSTNFEKEDGTTVQGKFTVVGSSSKEFYNYISGKSTHDVLTTKGDETGEMLASLIIGWEDTNFIDEPYSPEAALELMNDPNNLWLRHQLKDFMEDQANFF